MKKIVLVLFLLLTNSLFADYSDNFRSKLNDGMCNIHFIKDHLRLVDKNIDIGEKSLLEYIKSQNNPDCDEVVKYLKSIGALEGKEYAALKQKRATEALDGKLMGAPCSVDIVKQLIEKGANINQVNKNGDTPFTIFAQRGLRECNELARYLSSVGAKDSGYTFYRKVSSRYKYDTLKVFETKHLKMTVLDVDAYGYSKITFENKMPEPVYIKSQTTEVNGYKWFVDEGSYTINPYDKKDTYIRGANEEKGYKDRMPKVVNNKINFVRQATFKYTYKGKEYELKTSVIKDEIDIIYQEAIDYLFPF